MMKYVSGIIFSVFLVSIVSLTFPNGKMGKYIKSIFSFVLIFSIINPLLNLKNTSFDFKEIFVEKEIFYQQQYLDYVIDKKLNNYKNDCHQILEKLSVNNTEIDLIYYTDENYNLIVEKVNVNLRNSVINAEKEHIDIIKDIKNAFSNYFNINQNCIVVYE